MVSEEGLVKVNATIANIDQSNRHLILKLPDGDTVRLKASDAVSNFDKLKKGDKATVEYYESVAISLAKSDQEVAPAAAAEATLVPKDATNPEEMKVASMEVSATIEDIDKDKHEIKLKGPAGRSFKVKVDPSKQDISELKKGDKIVITYTEGLAVSAQTQ